MALTPTAPTTVLAIDPGREKCGVAIVANDAPPESVRSVRVEFREIVATERLVARVLQLLARHAIDTVLIGDGTQSAPLFKAVREILPETMELARVPEAFTSQRARERLRNESLPTGIARLVPRALRTPPRPYDDLVAILLAEDWFAGKNPSTVTDP